MSLENHNYQIEQELVKAVEFSQTVVTANQELKRSLAENAAALTSAQEQNKDLSDLLEGKDKEKAELQKQKRAAEQALHRKTNEYENLEAKTAYERRQAFVGRARDDIRSSPERLALYKSGIEGMIGTYLDRTGDLHKINELRERSEEEARKGTRNLDIELVGVVHDLILNTTISHPRRQGLVQNMKHVYETPGHFVGLDEGSMEEADYNVLRVVEDVRHVARTGDLMAQFAVVQERYNSDD